MPLDPYTLCPCGSGKKLKFCCSDMSGELEKIQRMTEGEQFQAALSHVERLLEHQPKKPALLAARGGLLAALGRLDESNEAYEALAAVNPENTLAMARRAERLAEQGELREAVALVQKALAASQDLLPAYVADAVETLAIILSTRGHITAALAHAMLNLALQPDDREAQGLVLRLQSAAVPQVLKQARLMREMPSIKGQAATDGLALARRGAWQAALDNLTPLASKNANSPELWQNLASLRAWTLDDEGAVEALHRYAALDVPLDDAVEAEFLAQLLTPVPAAERVPLVSISYPVHDAAQLRDNLAKEGRLEEVQLDPREAHEGPPPLAVYQVLDRPLPASAAAIKAAAEVPCALGQIALFGKETDREARLELTTMQDEHFGDVKEIITSSGFGLVGPAAEPEVLEPNYSFRGNMSRRWRLPDDATPEQVRELSRQQHEKTYFERWPNQPSWILGAQTPTQASRDPQRRIALLALILGLESAADTNSDSIDLNRLRQQLGLPVPGPIEVGTSEVHEIPPTRFARIDVKTLDDSQLEAFLYAAATVRADRAIRRLAEEVLGRDSLNKTELASRACAMLAGQAADPPEALQWIERGREIDKARGKSCAAWDLRELRLQTSLGSQADFQRLIEHLTAAHAREPGVRQAVMQFLVQIGAMTPDGRLVGAPAGPPETEAGLVLPESAAATPGEIWTPEGDRAASGRSALWTPDSG